VDDVDRLYPRRSSYLEAKKMKVSEYTPIQMPMRNLVAILGATAIAVWGFFALQERVNNVEMNYKLIIEDIDDNTDFRIRWPRGELGALPDDSEQFMLIAHMGTKLTRLQEQMEDMMHNKVNIMRLQDDMAEARKNIEKLKDSTRAIKFANGNNNHDDK